MEKAFFPRQDRDGAVISRLLPQLKEDTVDSHLDLLKISSVVDGTDIRGTGICHNHSYRWKMAIESVVKSIAVVPDRFFDIKGVSYRIDWDRKVSAASLPNYLNYKDAVIYRINTCARCMVPPLAKIIFDYNMQDLGAIVNVTYAMNADEYSSSSVSLGKVLEAASYVFYSNGACKKGNKWYVPLRDVKTPIYKDSLNKYSITDEPLFEVADITNPYWGNTFIDAIAITVDEVESTLVTYLQNGAMTELFTQVNQTRTGQQIADELGSVEKVLGYQDISKGQYLAIIVDNEDNYHALIGNESTVNDTATITWRNPSVPVDVSQFKGIDMWLRFQSINEMIYFLITKYEQDIINILPATIHSSGTPWAVNDKYTTVNKNEDGESEKSRGKLWAYINPRTMKPYDDDYWFHQGEPYYVKSLTIAPKGKTLKAQRITVKADQWPGMYMMVGETYIRDRDTGEDQRMQIKFPLCKVRSDHTLTLEADGDPTTFNLNLEVARPASGVMMELTSYEIAEKLLEGDNGCFYAVDGSTEVLSE